MVVYVVHAAGRFEDGSPIETHVLGKHYSREAADAQIAELSEPHMHIGLWGPDASACRLYKVHSRKLARQRRHPGCSICGKYVNR